MTYLVGFAFLPCTIIHTLLYHGQTLLNGLKQDVEADDIHAKLMRHYPEVPYWLYLTLFCISFMLAIVAVEVWDTGIPVWSLLLSIVLSVIYVLPSGIIAARTGLPVSCSTCLKMDCIDSYNDNRLGRVVSQRLLRGHCYLVIRLQIWCSRRIPRRRLDRQCSFCRTSSLGIISRFRLVQRFWVCF